MKKKLLTDVELRAQWSRSREQTYTVEEGTILTPSAMDFIREHQITLSFAGSSPRFASMTRVPIPKTGGRPVYIDEATGAELHEKPEEMTHLRGNLLVPKVHPRIEFRGRLDSLMAQIMSIQVTAEEEGELKVAEELEELLAYTRKILAAEVKEEPLAEISLLGMNSEEIRYASHHVKETLGMNHPIPDHRMGRLCVSLNCLRTQVREVELSAARAFYENGRFQRNDIIEGLNRMSSCVYIIFCRKLSGYYGGGKEA